MTFASNDDNMFYPIKLRQVETTKPVCLRMSLLIQYVQLSFANYLKSQTVNISEINFYVFKLFHNERSYKQFSLV